MLIKHPLLTTAWAVQTYIGQKFIPNFNTMKEHHNGFTLICLVLAITSQNTKNKW